MKKAWLWLAIALVPFCPAAGRIASSAPAAKLEPHRSPIDVAVLPGGLRALTANHTSDSVSLVDLATGKVLAEVPCGHRPAGVACSPDGCRAAVSNLWSGTLTLLEVHEASLRPSATISVGDQPRGLVFAPDGNSLYVALAGDNQVVQVDGRGKVLHRWPAPAEPRRLALTRDGRSLAAASARSAQVRCWDTATGRQLWERTITDAFTLHGLTFSPDGRDLIAAHCHDRRHAINPSNIREGWAIDNRLTRLSRIPDRDTPYWQIALDVRFKAVADPCAVAINARGDRLAVAAAGTHELLLVQPQAIPWSPGEPGDFLDGSLDHDDGRFRRVPLGGRPVAVAFAGDREEVVVANYLLDALQVVDGRTGRLVRQVPLGGPTQPSLARRGEAIFYDASRSLHQWFSCQTCHPDGHTSSRTFDTLNDDSYGNAKMTPSLRGVGHTGPWTWHGWQKDLGKAVERSLTLTLFGPEPPADNVRALVAFLKTLEPPPNPRRGCPGAERGKALFYGKAGCVRCHHGDYYTSPHTYDVGLESDDSPFGKWNPPSLRGVYDRGPYLHDGRADSLDELLRVHHRPEKLGGQALSPEERRYLVEFLKSL
jgi:YVTN family beta-propeller protein